MAEAGYQPRSSQGGISNATRMLAPLALLGLVLAIGLVVSSSLGEGGDGAGGGGGATTEQARNGSDEGGEPTPREYTVEPGDSLSGIAERFDISVERIQRLNPDVDPQTLGEGQTLVLRQPRNRGGSD